MHVCRHIYVYIYTQIHVPIYIATIISRHLVCKVMQDSYYQQEACADVSATKQLRCSCSDSYAVSVEWIAGSRHLELRSDQMFTRSQQQGILFLAGRRLDGVSQIEE